jgi:hypothetical protein
MEAIIVFVVMGILGRVSHIVSATPAFGIPAATLTVNDADQLYPFLGINLNGITQVCQ